MTTSDRSDGSRFTVDLGSIKLPTVVEKQVETDIRSVVLRALASPDVVGRTRLPDSIFDTFPGQTLGLWLDPESGTIVVGDGTLRPSDHTLILREVLRFPLQLLKALGAPKDTAKPSGTTVLEAALKIDEIDSYTKRRIEAVADILPRIEEEVAKTSRSRRKSLSTLENELAGKDLHGQIATLRNAETRDRISDNGLLEGMEIAAQILEDGAGSIYSPDHSFYRILSSGRRTARRDALGDISSADTIGATAGGAAGSLIGGVGAGPGAVAGGTGASVGWAAAALIDWILE